MSELPALKALEGKNILVLGFDEGYVTFVSWLAGQTGSSVTVCDLRPGARQGSEGGVTWQGGTLSVANTGGFDVIVRHSTVPYRQTELMQAVARGVQVTSAARLFFQVCPCEVIGICGTLGKTTTLTYATAFLENGYSKGKVYSAENVAMLFSSLSALEERDVVILELSSSELEDLHISPHVAVVVASPAADIVHHKSAAAYHEALANALAHQRPNDYAILSAEYPAAMATEFAAVKGRVTYYSQGTAQKESAWVTELDGKEVLFVQQGNNLESIDISERAWKGPQALAAILPAVLVALHHGVKPSRITEGLRAVTGLPYHCESCGESNGALWVNDGASVTPEATMAAMKSFQGKRLHLLLGGTAGGQSLNDLVHATLERCASVTILDGPAGPSLEKLLRTTLRSRHDCECFIAPYRQGDTMEQMLSGIVPHLQPGDVVLFSPGMRHREAHAPDRSQAFTSAVAQRQAPNS